ncbi:MAG TPA: hypothetical protein VIV11_32180 [Kofleriaceae bacterium]
MPTRWQLLQAEVEMTPFVISTDATAEEGYRRSVLAHPLLRQALIFGHVGRDHLRTGSALGARLESICAHLIVTFHRGMPVFDLQVIQTHQGGLVRLAAAIEETRLGSTSTGRSRRALARRLFRDPDAYLAQFADWIARAASFDYPHPADEGSNFPPEFFSLVALAEYAAQSFPARPGDLAWTRYPAHVVGLASRRFRDGNGFGWFSRRSS